MWNHLKSAYLYIVRFMMSKDKEKGQYSFSNRIASRKYILTILIFLAGTLLCGLPPLLSVFIYNCSPALVVLSGTEWVTVITMLCGFYFGANVAQKKLMDKTSKNPNEAKKEEEKTETPIEE